MHVTDGPPEIDLRRSGERFRTAVDRLQSWHSLSYGAHYDAGNVRFGLLVAHNEEVLAGAAGFSTHAHQGVELVTWVLEGRLRHSDSTGRDAVVGPGTVQRLSAGRGVRHSERNQSRTQPVHYVQMWVLTDEPGSEPQYDRAHVAGQLARGGLVPVVSGLRHPGVLALRQRQAALYVGRLSPDEVVALPDASWLHVFVARGTAVVGEAELAQGDAVRVTRAAGLTLRGGASGAEVLAWEMHGG